MKETIDYKLQNLENRLSQIEIRNKKVEAEKAWETSWQRKLSIAAITYITISSVFLVLQVDRPFLQACIPTLGFILSTLSVTFLKNHLYVPAFFTKPKRLLSQIQHKRSY